ncbi:WD40-repeat-containing domain protein [Boletus edulis BED1]|uniref:DNA damage-binding protein CMR1 n=1 Tax=Boletus edulis BED1 TaxID=1328754 RepID=A0AAD4C2J5_BOLED|nr:WD40-repeat-containing domain protein [Boletus edulis BED1]
MSELSAYEQEREANIARNRALLEQLELKDAVAALGVSVKPKPAPKPKAKPVQAAKRVKRESTEEAPRRQSARLRKDDAVDPNETPAQRRKRLAEAEARRKKEEEERILAEEHAHLAKRPRAQELDLSVLTAAEELGDEEMNALRASLQAITHKPIPRCIGSVDAWVYDSDKHDAREAEELRKRLGQMKVASRAKVTQNRVYSAAYHPEPTKDLIFFGDKHGQVGIWDAQAPVEEVADEDDEVTPADEKSGGKYWRLQQHWPATAKSSISSIRIDPIDSHRLYTTSYDCTVRQLTFVSGVSRQIYSSSDVLISSLELSPSGHEMWISDVSGGATHLDLREGPSHTRWYGLSDQKIGSVSINPTSPHLILTASNSRSLKIWDARKLDVLLTQKQSGGATSSSSPPSPSKYTSGPFDFDFERVQKFIETKKGSGALRGEYAHGKSVTSAYWDPRGRSIVSTSYDDTLRIWELDAGKYDASPVFPAFTPFSRIKHGCQTGRWLTPLRAVWTPNPDVYPHFTVGNLDHSLNVYSCKGELVAKLSDSVRITATQAVTCSHPSVVERCATGNASGRCVLWAPPDLA